MDDDITYSATAGLPKDSNKDILPAKRAKIVPDTTSAAAPTATIKAPKKLSKKERKRLEKIVEKKKTRDERPALYAELAKYQLGNNVLDNFESSALLGSEKIGVGLKKRGDSGNLKSSIKGAVSKKKKGGSGGGRESIVKQESSSEEEDSEEENSENDENVEKCDPNDGNQSDIEEFNQIVPESEEIASKAESARAPEPETSPINTKNLPIPDLEKYSAFKN